MFSLSLTLFLLFSSFSKEIFSKFEVLSKSLNLFSPPLSFLTLRTIFLSLLFSSFFKLFLLSISSSFFISSFLILFSLLLIFCFKKILLFPTIFLLLLILLSFMEFDLLNLNIFSF